MTTFLRIFAGMGSRQFCRGRGRGRGREVEAEARQGSNVLNRGEARQRPSEIDVVCVILISCTMHMTCALCTYYIVVVTCSCFVVNDIYQ